MKSNISVEDSKILIELEAENASEQNLLSVCLIHINKGHAINLRLSPNAVDEQCSSKS